MLKIKVQEESTNPRYFHFNFMSDPFILDFVVKVIYNVDWVSEFWFSPNVLFLLAKKCKILFTIGKQSS